VPAILNYLIHLLLAAVLLAVFFKAYTWMTPFDEVLLIRQGNQAAALSLGGALIGFSITIGSALMHTADYREFFRLGLRRHGGADAGLRDHHAC
jgi:putative membrane protein